MFFPVTEISERGSWHSGFFLAVFCCCWVGFFVCFLNPYGLYPKKFVTHVLSTFLPMLYNTLDWKTQESTSLFQSKHNTAVDVWLDWAGTYCHILLTKKHKKICILPLEG